MTKDEALKLALEALEWFTAAEQGDEPPINKTITAIKEALAQPEQEPVEWGVDWGKAGDIPCVSIIKRLPDGGIGVLAVEYAPYSYTTPPKREWHGLTDEEKKSFWRADQMTHDEWQQLFAEIETKLKEKNT